MIGGKRRPQGLQQTLLHSGKVEKMRGAAQAISIGGITTCGSSGLSQDSDVFGAACRRPKPLQGHRTNRHVVAKAEPELRNLHLQRGLHRFSSGALRQAYGSTRAGPSSQAGTNSHEISVKKRRAEHERRLSSPYTGSLPNTRYFPIHSVERMKARATDPSSATTSSTAMRPARAVARMDRPIRDGAVRKPRAREAVARQPFHCSVPCGEASPCLHARLCIVRIADCARHSSANSRPATATSWLAAIITESFVARCLARRWALIRESVDPYWKRRSSPGHGVAFSTPNIAASSGFRGEHRPFA